MCLPVRTGNALNAAVFQASIEASVLLPQCSSTAPCPSPPISPDPANPPAAGSSPQESQSLALGLGLGLGLPLLGTAIAAAVMLAQRRRSSKVTPAGPHSGNTMTSAGISGPLQPGGMARPAAMLQQMESAAAVGLQSLPQPLLLTGMAPSLAAPAMGHLQVPPFRALPGGGGLLGRPHGMAGAQVHSAAYQGHQVQYGNRGYHAQRHPWQPAPGSLDDAYAAAAAAAAAAGAAAGAQHASWYSRGMQGTPVANTAAMQSTPPATGVQNTPTLTRQPYGTPASAAAAAGPILSPLQHQHYGVRAPAAAATTTTTTAAVRGGGMGPAVSMWQRASTPPAAPWHEAVNLNLTAGTAAAAVAPIPSSPPQPPAGLPAMPAMQRLHYVVPAEHASALTPVPLLGLQPMTSEVQQRRDPRTAASWSQAHSHGFTVAPQ